MARNRWLGLAVVALLALLAQPAAVVEAPAASASADGPAPEEGCQPVADVEELPTEDLLDADVRTPELDACLTLEGDPVDAVVDERVDVVLE